MIQRAPIFSRSLHSSNFIQGISILFLSSGRRRIFSFASQDERAPKEGNWDEECGGRGVSEGDLFFLKVYIYVGSGRDEGFFRDSQMIERG